MFTGIIQALGKVESISSAKSGGRAARVTVSLGRLAKGLKRGDSVSINGACLTVVGVRKGGASFEMIGETMKKTALGALEKGERVNVERSLRIGDSLDGHFVMGHVDCVGTIIEKRRQKDQTKIWLELGDKSLMKYVVPKGSISLDGVSLTVVDVRRDRFSVTIIPRTIAVTTLGIKGRGSRLNVEIDMLTKYASKFLKSRRTG